MKPTLFVLAAGMGSRYGGLKQLDGLGPNGETIMDYSIFDALRGGFGKVVFVIRKDFEQDFKDKILSKYEGHIPCELVFQSIDDLPEGFTCPEGRTKPWGTNHAVLMGKDVIKEPFAVINADDFFVSSDFFCCSSHACICLLISFSDSSERSFSPIYSGVKSCVSTTLPTAFASLACPLGITPGVKGSLFPNTLTSFLGRNNIFTAIQFVT